ncbi:MAG: hypothetical protein RBS43_09650, partial [Candidatus Cloacimonas sp.]|nr:hypothetical protein [Candidatus Cloacimonas sp.]
MSSKIMLAFPHISVETMGSQLIFQIVSGFFQIGGLRVGRYHDFFKSVSRFFQMEFHEYFKLVFYLHSAEQVREMS